MSDGAEAAVNTARRDGRTRDRRIPSMFPQITPDVRVVAVVFAAHFQYLPRSHVTNVPM